MLGISLKTLHNKLNRFKSGELPLNNELSLKQKQVLVVTLMVAIIVIALSLLLNR